MAYTTINKQTDHFNTKLFTGTGSTNAQTGVGFQPDMVWFKNRSEVYSHQLYDVVRGVTKRILPDVTTAEETDANGLTAFGTDGFTVGSNVGINKSSNNIVAWNWKAGGGQGSSNTDGSINTTYTSVNTTAGFSISQYTGNGTYQATVGHGLGAVPKMIIVKGTSFSREWVVYHESMGNTKNMHLNDNSAQATEPTWGNTTPTNQVFTISGASQANWYDTNKPSETYIAYCFAEKQGYSKFGSYTGNGNADGTFVYTGFKPAFVITKKSSGTDEWNINDTTRDSYSNPLDANLLANTSAAESDHDRFDAVSNGFKMRTDSGQYNASGSTYIYMAFGQSLVGSNNVPCTAR